MPTTTLTRRQAVITGNQLARLANNPVLRRRMFTTPAQKAAMARGAFGVNASGPELIRASSTVLSPAQLSAQLRGTTTDQGEFEGVGPQTDPGFTPPVNQRSEQEAEESRRIGSGPTEILADDPNVSSSTPAPAPAPESQDDNPKPKPKSVKSTIDDVINSIANMTGTKEQASKKTRKQKFQEAKDFLVEAGVTQAKDVRTDRDFLMMLGGLKFAAGSGTGSMSQDAVAALSSVLGTFASGKQEERQLEQKINMAAAERVLAQEDTDKATAAARQLALDKLAITAQLQKAEMEQDPKMIREVKAIMDETGVSFTEALKLQQASDTKPLGAELRTAEDLIRRGFDPAVARLIAREPSLVEGLLEGRFTKQQLLDLINELGGPQQSSGNTNSIPLTGNEDQTA